MTRTFTVTSAVAVCALTVAASVSPLGGGLAHASGYGPEVFYVQSTDVGETVVRAPAIDPTQTTTVLSGGENLAIGQVQVSPLGGRVAAIVQNENSFNDDEHLVVMDRDGRNRHSLVSFGLTEDSETAVFGFDWAPDGRSIAYGQVELSGDADADPATVRAALRHPFAAPSDLGVSFSLHEVSAVGTPRTSAIKGGAGFGMPAFSPSGEQISAFHYDTSSDEGAATLDRITLATGDVSKPLVSTTEDAIDPSYSPDGVHIAYSQDTTDQSNENAAETADIDEVAANGSSNGIPTRLATGGTTNDDEFPAWSSPTTVWFDQQTEDPDTDENTAGDLYSVSLPASGQQAAAPVNETNTTSIDEASTSFGPATDTGVPAKVSFRPFVLGTHATTVQWTNPSDTEFSHVQVRRNGTLVYTGPQESFADKGAIVGHHYTYAIQSFSGTDVPGGTVTKSVVATATPSATVPHPVSNRSAAPPFPVSWKVHNPASTTYTVEWAKVDVLGGRLAITGPEHVWLRHTHRTAKVFGAHGSPTRPAVGQTYVLRVKTYDTRGNSSAWSAQSRAVLPVDQTTANQHGPWRTVHARRAWLGSYATTSTDQASLTFHVIGSGVRVLVDTCRTCGSFDVYLGGKYGGSYLGSFGTHSGSNHYRVQQFNYVFDGVGVIGKHTIRVVAHLSPGQQLRVDGMVVFHNNPPKVGDGFPIPDHTRAS